MTSARVFSSLRRQWLLLVAGLATTSCVPQVFEISDFKKHLTAAEKSELAAGQTVNKLHSSYWVMYPKQLYWEGPLHIQPLPGGKLEFTPFGHWMQYDEHGGLLCESTYTVSSVGSAGRSRMYYPAGFLQMVTEGKVALLDGDSVLEVRLAQFRAGNETDTAYVEKRWAKDGEMVKPAVRSFDWQGKHPVPKKWKYKQ